MIDRPAFIAAIRTTLFSGRLSAAQREGLGNILDRFGTLQPDGDIRNLAYMLATAHHETGRTMQPIRERGGTTYLRRLYDVTGARPVLARRMGNTTPGDGVRFAGRGLVQLTWRNNYRDVGARLGIDLLGDPDLALEPVTSADIMIRGMTEGWFTGRKLGDYIGGAKADWRNARRVVNGLDNADLIKSHALAYLAALQARAVIASRRAAASVKAQGPNARNSTPVAARAATASGPGAKPMQGTLKTSAHQRQRSIT
jgi:putative chitinase